MAATPERIQEVKAMENVVTPMPQYQSHKKVWALKIKAVEPIRPTIAQLESMLNDEANGKEIPGAIIVPAEPHFAAFFVSKTYVDKHDPQVGGYYVQYDDGYKSFSPAKAFEEGYTRI